VKSTTVFLTTLDVLVMAAFVKTLMLLTTGKKETVGVSPVLLKVTMGFVFKAVTFATTELH